MKNERGRLLYESETAFTMDTTFPEDINLLDNDDYATPEELQRQNDFFEWLCETCNQDSAECTSETCPYVDGKPNNEELLNAQRDHFENLRMQPES